MYLVTKIKMKNGCIYSSSLLEIDEIFISGAGTSSGYYKKEIIHDFLRRNPGAIKVNISPYPTVIPAVSMKGEKYVRSSPDGFPNDNLLMLPRDN